MLSLLLLIIMGQLLKVFNAVKLHFLKLLFLKLTFQIQVALHPCDPILINNCSMTANSVENYCFIVLNVKLRVKRRFKIFTDF